MSVIIRKINNSHIQVKCKYKLSKLLKKRYAFFAQDYKFAPKFKQGIWDGKIYLFDIETGFLPIGFAKDVYKFIKKRCSDVICDLNIFENGIDITDDEINAFCKSIKLPFAPYEHQIETVKLALKKRRMVFESATNSGKSLSMFITCNFLKMYNENEKILIIVPDTQLVEQLSSDFCEYIENYDPYYEKNINKMYGGNKPYKNRFLYIATWQTLQHCKPAFMKQFTTVMVDEVHSASSGVVLQNLITETTNAENKFGFTGTVSQEIIHKKQLNGLFGPIKNIITAKELIDKEMAAPFNVKAIVLKYDKAKRQELKTIIDKIPKSAYNKSIVKYQSEMKYIRSLPEKIKIINKISNTPKTNTILMFRSIAYGKQLYKELKKGDKRIYYIDGSIGVPRREEIRAELEKYDNCILVGSYKTISRGINIKNIHNVILAESLKAELGLIQTIGRILRLCGEDKKATLIDLVDDLSTIYPNFAMKHFKKRQNIYKRQGHEVIIKKVRL